MSENILDSPEFVKGYFQGYNEGYIKALENYLDQINIMKPASSIIVECRKEKCDFYKETKRK